MTDPILNDTPWGYWPFSYSAIDVSGNANELSVFSYIPPLDVQYGWYFGFQGIRGARSTVVWDTGFTPSGDWTFRAIIQRDGGGHLLFDGVSHLDAGGMVAYADLWGTYGYHNTSAWGYTPYNIPIVLYVVSSGGNLTYYWANWYPDGPGPVSTGSLGADPFGALRFGNYGNCFYAQVAIFDYALSPWRVGIQMSGAEPALPESASTLVDEMLADSPQAVWAVPSDYDTIPDAAVLAADATTSGPGFTASDATSTVGGFLTSASTWDLPVALDTTAFTAEFAFRASEPGVTGDVTLSSGDVTITAVGTFGSNDYEATAGSDVVSWSSPFDTNVHLVGVTWDAGGDLILYVDGVARASTPVTGAITPAASLTFSSPDATQFAGTVAVYDTALSAGRMLVHGEAVMPPMLDRVEVDTFDRVDGAIGNTSLRGLPWSTVSGAPVTTGWDGTYAVATGGMALVEGIPYARGVVAEVNKGASPGKVTIGLVAADYEFASQALYGVLVDFAADTVQLVKRFNGVSWSSILSPFTVDLSAGTAEVRFQLDAFTQHDGGPSPDYWAWEASIRVDGVVIASNLVIDDLRDADMDAEQVGWYTESTGTLSWLDALEGPYEVGQTATIDQTGGLEFRFWPFDGVLLGSSTQGSQTGGLAPPGDPIRDSRPVFLGASPTVPQRGGIRTIWTNGPLPPPPVGEPPIWVGVGAPTDELQVAGYEYKDTNASCNPTLNGPGSGQMTVLPPGPALGDVLTFSSGGSVVFTGYVDAVKTVIANQAEESGQLVSVNAVDMLSIDWTETVIWPDFGAFEPIRLGAPPQDDREWGWPMNGMVDDENLASLVSSVGNNPDLYGTVNEVLPIPDNWPDSTARWMWDKSPDEESQPQGWVYFRVPFGTWPGRYACFLNAWDYAKMWIDGAMIAEVTTPGQTVRFDVEFDWDYHLIAIAAYNEGGSAGVMCSIMKHSTDGSGLLAAPNQSGLDAPAMNSRGGWKTLAYPERTLRGSTGKVLRTLVREAAARGAPAGGWSCSFTDQADSAGRAWPEDESLVTTKTGQTYWDALNMFAEDRIDFHPSPAGKTLYVYRKGEGAGSVAQPWAHTVHAESLETEVRGR